ncbi:hypothetical protein FPV67DRAFT_726707 [Lyophyllum atratum]|nr:hypothetical protein FPV67DRAFT_726707 [Lyophyllum atratum]
MIDEQQRTNCEAVNDEPSHWISYSGEASGYHEDLDPRSLMISVVLDAGCQREFSGIRLVILRRDSEGAEATVRDCPELFKFYNGHHTHQRHRDALTSLRTSGELSNSLLRDYARGSQGRKICTVIFELVLVRADGDPTSEQKAYAKLSLLQRQELNPGDHAFHILYDHAQQSNTPLLLFLQCSHTSITKSCLTAIDRWSSTGPRIYVHRVRILPLVSNRPVPVSLPLPLLKRCVSYAFVQRQRGWREGLLSCGLVCRSWAPILDLFFQHFHHPKMLQFRPPDISAVAVSLQRTPFRAALVRGYTPLLYTTPRPETVTKFFESQNSILRQAKSVEELIIGSTHPSLSEELLRILGGLREVRTFKVSRMILPSYRQISKEDIYDLNISEIQSAIALWPHLTTLKITDWKSPITSNTTGPHNPSIQHPALSDSLPMGTEFEVGVLLVI